MNLRFGDFVRGECENQSGIASSPGVSQPGALESKNKNVNRMEWLIVIVLLAILFYFFVMKKHGNLDFWKIAAKNPDSAYQLFKDEDCWLIFEDKSLALNFPPGEWDGPFKLSVPMLGGKIITVYGKVPEYFQSQQRFMRKQSVTITSAQVIKLLITEVANTGASELLNECEKIGMRQIRYQNIGLDSNLPPFDTGYHLRFNPDGKEEALFEILQKDGFVLQAGYQLVLQRAQNRYQQLKQILESHYGVGYPMNVGEIELINYGNEKTIAYLSHTKISGNDVITIRVGNRRFWD